MYHVGTIMAKIRTVFNVLDSAECRLWKRNMTNTYELVTKANETVLEARLSSGHVSEIEVVNFVNYLCPQSHSF